MTDFLDYMIQHALYIQDMEKSLRDDRICLHKAAHECAFGKLFYGTFKPHADSYPETQRHLLERIESVHSEFHKAAGQVQPDDPDSEAHRAEAREYSLELLSLLDQLEKSGLSTLQASFTNSASDVPTPLRTMELSNTARPSRNVGTS